MIVISHVNQCRRWSGHKIYCGRKYGGYRQSPLANVPRKKGQQPGDTLPAYKSWLWGQMQDSNSPAMKELQRIRKIEEGSLTGRVILMCWCHDAQKCHCSVIYKAIRWLDKQEGGA